MKTLTSLTRVPRPGNFNAAAKESKVQLAARLCSQIMLWSNDIPTLTIEPIWRELNREIRKKGN